MQRKIEKLTPLAMRENIITWLRVAAYARVSSGKDAMLQSLSAQVSYFSAYIQRHKGWQYAGVYADNGQSGQSFEHPSFQRMLADMESRKINCCVILSFTGDGVIYIAVAFSTLYNYFQKPLTLLLIRCIMIM
jgi:predicted site-specific integrase-resolvase